MSFLDPEKSKILKLNIFDELRKKKDRILEGYDDVFEFIIFLKELENRITSIKDEIKPSIFTELKQNDNKIEVKGYKVSVTSGGRYNYKEVKEIAELETELKRLKKFSQLACKSNLAEFINSETGEIIKSAEYVPNKKSFKIEKIK